MLSSVPLARLIEATPANKALCGAFLPTNNNPSFSSFQDVYTVSIVDTDGTSPIAFGAINMYSQKQAYCMVGEVSDKYHNSTIWLEDKTVEKSHVVLKISKSETGKPDHSGLGMFRAVFGDHEERPIEEYLMQWMVNKTVGNDCLDLNKNVTLDVVGKRNLNGWRDNAGFVVTDNQHFVEMTCKKSDLVSLDTTSFAKIVPLTAENKEILIEYDATCTMLDRSDYIDALLKTSDIRGALAIDEHNTPYGYVLTLGSRILSCYAEKEEISSFAASQITAPEVSLYTCEEAFGFMDELVKNAVKVTPVTRLHTRTLIKQVKWNKVFCHNIGLHLF
ncbi:unnamed protein product, partial [Mesorhabditis spiculigera]